MKFSHFFIPAPATAQTETELKVIIANTTYKNGSL